MISATSSAARGSKLDAEAGALVRIESAGAEVGDVGKVRVLPLAAAKHFHHDGPGGRREAPAVADFTPLAKHGDVVVKDFVFHTGERLPELRLHYVTWGTPRHGADGGVANAVLLLVAVKWN